MTRASSVAVALAIVAALAVGDVAGQRRNGMEEGSIDELRSARDLLVEAADFAAALPPAAAIVEALERAGDPARGADLLRLARIQAGLAEFDDAEESYLRAIELIAENEGRAAPALIAAHQGLGRIYLNGRRFEEALVALEEARSISRQVGGLFNVEQAALLDDMTLAHLGSGDTLTAMDLQEERLENALRRFDADDARMIPFHVHFGDYLDNSRLRRAAREQYARALEVSEASFGAVSGESLGLLRRLVEVDLLLDDDTGTALQAEELLAQLPELGAFERAGVLATLGDWALVYQGPEAAAPRYREAYGLLDSLEGVDAEALFANPKPLNLIPPLSRVDLGTRRDPWSWGDLTLEFDVAADGRASNVRIAAMSPENEDVALEYERRIREAFFRPRLVAGEAVATSGVRYQHNFRFYVRD